MVMALISILSFSVVYCLQSSPNQSLKQSQKLVEKMLQTARSTAILRNRECRLLVLDNPDSADSGRLLTILVKENSGQWKGTSTFVTLPEGIGVSFDQCSKAGLGKAIGEKNELWNSISFSSRGFCGNRLYLKSMDDDSIKMIFTMTAAGGIEID